MNDLWNAGVHMPKPVLLGLAAGFVFVCGSYALRASAQPPAPVQTSSAAPKPAPPASGGKRRVSFFGKQQSYTEKTGIYDLRGDVWFKSEDTTLTTDYATYNKATKIASSPGPLKVVDTLNTVTGNTGTAFYNTKDIKLRGNVVIVARPRDADLTAPEGSPRRQFDAPATITCETVDYNWGTRVAFLTGGLKVVQKNRTVTADKATYDGRLERVTLEGNVYYTTTQGDKARFTKAIINMKKGEEDFHGENASGEFTTDELEDTPATPPAAPGTPAPGTAPTPTPGTAPKPTPGSPDPAKPDPTKPEPSTPEPGKPAEPNPATPTPPTPADPKDKP